MPNDSPDFQRLARGDHLRAEEDWNRATSLLERFGRPMRGQGVGSSQTGGGDQLLFTEKRLAYAVANQDIAADTGDLPGTNATVLAWDALGKTWTKTGETIAVASEATLASGVHFWVRYDSDRGAWIPVGGLGQVVIGAIQIDSAPNSDGLYPAHNVVYDGVLNTASEGTTAYFAFDLNG